MKDSRTSLPPNTVLRLTGPDRASVSFTIVSEIGRGGTGIIYDARYADNLSLEHRVRIKEFCPWKLSITRDASGALVIPPTQAKTFSARKDDFIGGYRRLMALREDTDKVNSLSDPIDIYPESSNHTAYIVTAYSNDRVLRTDPARPLRDTLSLVKSIAAALDQLHRSGHLYLDLKPANVLTFPETPEMIRLFDFDSDDDRLSFTRGCAAPEVIRRGCRTIASLKEDPGEDCRTADPLRKDPRAADFLPEDPGENRRVADPRPDVFSLGATLFCLLYGRTPDAFDCEENAVFGFPTACPENEQDLPDCFLPQLNHFLRKTISAWPGNRFRDMGEVIRCLEKLLPLADPSKAFVRSTVIPPPACFVGRDREVQAIHRWFEDSSSPCLFVTGMGGIGKSTLIQAALCSFSTENGSLIPTFSTENRSLIPAFEPVLYLTWRNSLAAVLTDDTAVHINTVRRYEEETRENYFRRKLHALKNILHGKKALLVIDNYDYADTLDEDFPAVLDVGWKILIGTRSEDIPREYSRLSVREIRDIPALRHLFEVNMGSPVSDSDLPFFNNILRKTDCHTLILTLIARQISASCLSIAEASDLMDRHGFSHMASEKISYTKDRKQVRDTLIHILNSLFSVNPLDETSRQILQFLSVFGTDGIPVEEVQRQLQLSTKDEINELQNRGWLRIQQNHLSFHPVIAETVMTWTWDDGISSKISGYLQQLCETIAGVSIRKELPRNLLENIRDIFSTSPDDSPISGTKNIRDVFRASADISPGSRIKKIMFSSSERKILEWIAGYVMANDLRNQPGKAAADSSQRTLSIISTGDICQQLSDLPAYQLLFLLAALYMPVDEEAFILKYAGNVLDRIDPELPSADFFVRYCYLRLCRRVMQIHLSQNRLERAAACIRRAEPLLRFREPLVAALYYDMLGSFFDSRLAGAYIYDNEYSDRENLLDAIEEMILCLRRIPRLKDPFSRIMSRIPLCYASLDRLNILCRCYPERTKEIRKAFREAESAVRKYAEPESELMYQYYLVTAAYDYRILHSPEPAEAALRTAADLASRVISSDLELIDQLYIPRADLYLEQGLASQSESVLLEAIAICHRHSGMDPYIRKEADLKSYLQDVYHA